MPDDLLQPGTDAGTPPPAEGTLAASTAVLDAADAAAATGTATEQTSAAPPPQPEDPVAKIKRLESQLAGTKGALTASQKERDEFKAQAAEIAGLKKYVEDAKQREVDLKRATVTNQWVETELATYQQELAGMGIYDEAHVDRLTAVRKRDLTALATVAAQAELAEQQQAKSKAEADALSYRRYHAGLAATSLLDDLKAAYPDFKGDVTAEDLISRLKVGPLSEQAQEELVRVRGQLFRELSDGHRNRTTIAGNAERTATGVDAFERGGQPSLPAREVWRLWGRQDPAITKDAAIAARAQLVKEGVLLR